MKNLKNKISKENVFEYCYRLRSKFQEYFVASGTDSEEVRKKHKRVAMLIGGSVVALLIGAVILSDAIDSGTSSTSSYSSGSKGVGVSSTKRVDIKKLASGATHEQIWLEGAEKELLALKTQQQVNQDTQTKLQEYLQKESLSKKELSKVLEEFEKQISKKYEEKLEEQIKSRKQELNQSGYRSSIDVAGSRSKARVKRIGEYIPAGSYVDAKMISGIDAGVGISAEADPRQVLLRVTGRVISAGYGRDYLTTDKLMGCIVQCQAVGDLSSEKAYLKPVLMTCAKAEDSVIEIPVKGYVTSKGKVGIRGEVISREGDLVTNSFLSGMLGGIGNGASQFFQPNYAVSGSGFVVKQSDQAKNILGSGVGSGVSESSNRLSEYFIKRAEQYQPVISINEGVGVELVFQEGFSLKEEEVSNVKA